MARTADRLDEEEELAAAAAEEEEESTIGTAREPTPAAAARDWLEDIVSSIEVDTTAIGKSKQVQQQRQQ
jgi:hypothetical protein